MKEWTQKEKKQFVIFAAVNFGMTIIMGILMGISYYMGNDVTAFPMAQMMYPAAGVILARMLTADKEEKLPFKFFVIHLVTAGTAVLLTVGGMFTSPEMGYLIENYVIIAGSIIGLIMLLCEKKDVKERFGLRFKGHHVGLSLWMMLLFLILYIARLLLSGLTDGSAGEVAALFASPATWGMMALLAVTFFLSYNVFWGEEYGWRFFMQPLFQRRFGLKAGVILLGVIWGLWHIPINIFYYSPDTWIYSILLHQITCITLAVFFGYAYRKTGNVWVPVVMHYINNNMAMVVTGSADLGNNVYGWKDVLVLLAVNGIAFMPFLFSTVYREKESECDMGQQVQEI